MNILMTGTTLYANNPYPVEGNALPTKNTSSEKASWMKNLLASSPVGNRGVAGEKNPENDAKEVSEKVEAMFLGFLTKKMFESTRLFREKGEGLFGKLSMRENIFQDMLLDEYNQVVASHTYLGIAEALEKELRA